MEGLNQAMKKLAIALGMLTVLAGVLVAIISFGVWRATQETLTPAPSEVQVGRQNLRGQLEEAKKRESQIEKQNWNSGTQLRALIQSHEQRIEKLNGNPEAAEILAYDHDSVTRLQNRINQLIAMQAEEADEETDAAAQNPPATPQN